MYRSVAKGEIGTQSFEIPYKDERFSGFYDVTVFRAGVSMIVVGFNDITERKRAEEKIQNLLAEKELILKEVNHRVKNKMNTMRSILRLQAGTMNDASIAAAFEEAGNRMQSMEILYDQLYQTTSGLGVVALKLLLERIPGMI